MTGILFGCLGAVIGGTQIFLVKSALDERAATVVASIIPLLGLVWYLPVVAVFAPEDATVKVSGLSPVAWTVIVAGIITGALGTLLFFAALRAGEASRVAPISKTVPLFVLPLEIALLPVSLGGLNVLGVVGITLGLYIANYENGLIEPLTGLFTTRPVRLALASAVSFGIFDVIQRTLLQEFALTSTTWVVLNRGGIGLSLLAVVLVGGTARRGVEDVPVFVFAGLLNSLLFYFSVRAFTLLPASIASPVINTQSVVAVVLGGVVLDEPYFGRRMIAVGVIVTGVALVSI